MSAAELAACKAKEDLKKAKKAQKKKRSKEAKRLKKTLKDSETQKEPDWVKLCDADAESSNPLPSTPCKPLVPPTPTPHRLLSTPTPTPRRPPAPPASTPSSSPSPVSPSGPKKIRGLMGVLVANPYPTCRVLLDSPIPSSNPSNPLGTPQHASRHSRSEPAPASCKRDRSRSVTDKALGHDDLRHCLKSHPNQPKFADP